MRILIALSLLLVTGCSYTINLTVALPADTPTVSVEPQPQTQHDSFDL